MGVMKGGGGEDGGGEGWRGVQLHPQYCLWRCIHWQKRGTFSPKCTLHTIIHYDQESLHKQSRNSCWICMSTNLFVPDLGDLPNSTLTV